MGKRIRAQRKGSSPRYKASSHRFPGASRIPRVDGEVGKVTELVHSPIHTAPLARVKFSNGETTLVVCTEGVSVGSSIAIGSNVSIRPGNVTTLSQIPEGTPINNVELRPGDGGKIARTAGNSCLLVARLDNGKVRIELPSGKLKEIVGSCRATIGVLAGHGRSEKPLMKAGTAHYKAKARGKAYPRVSGVAMNPVDHPHGGGNHQAVHGPNSVSRRSPPGSKVGNIAPRQTGRGGKAKKEEVN
ncbi:MAG: 50S ribosomal protein L2 [Euryarchaeota archaeon]|jgi:large subunit ribosomal protein L2|nr:50S ribosomal protein L2 [Euryarchaeota archaeon]MBT4407378.1 50S ribosomal protein L2 [Euryarchaeota archaeon]MBT6644707.1 50S ribosomal protein L2 [Euryarchaeota archaeon]